MLLLVIVIFLTITLVIFIFGAAFYAPSSVIGTRLRALGWQKEQQPEKTPIKERLEQALDPFSKALPLSADEVSRASLFVPSLRSRSGVAHCVRGRSVLLRLRRSAGR